MGIVAFSDYSEASRSLMTVQDKNDNRIDFTIGENSQQQIVQFLIKHGYM